MSKKASSFESETVRNALSQAHEKLISIMKFSPDMILLTDMSGNIEFFSDSVISLLKFERDEVKGRSILALISDEYGDYARKSIDSVASGESAGVQRYRMASKYGMKFWVESNGSVIRDNSGADRGLFFIMRDVTKRLDDDDNMKLKSLEESLKNQRLLIDVMNMSYRPSDWNEAFESILERVGRHSASKSASIYLMDSQGFLDVSHSWFKEAGIGKSDSASIDSTLIPDFIRMLESHSFALIPSMVSESEDVSNVFSLNHDESILVLPLPKKRRVSGFLKLVFNSDRKLRTSEISSLKSIAKTISNAIEYMENEERVARTQKQLKKAIAEAEYANMAKSEFLANMSHEIRTPLNAIIGFMELIEKSGLSYEQQDYVRESKNASETLLYIVNDILDFSKIEAGKLELESISFNLRSVIEDAVMLSFPRAHAKGIGLNMMIYSDVPVYVNGDPGKLKQVLNNLVGNAVKFTNSGEVTIYAKNVTDGDDSDIKDILFSVVDTGIGINESTMKTIFRPFSQADSSTTRKYGGTGLGLAISKRIVDMMGSEIAVESDAGKGTTFKFKVGFECKKIEEYRHTLSEASNLENNNILIVDESATSREIIKKYLEDAGAGVYESESPSAALSFLLSEDSKKADINCIIVDYKLNGMNGIELAKTLKSIERTKEISLVLITALGKKGESEIAKKAGFKGYLTKPIRLNELIECISIVINKGHDTNIAPIVTKHIAKERNYESKKKILVVEDNEINQKVILNMLYELGLSSDLASNGQEAVEAVQNRKYDLVFMDCQMPVMDGYEATKHIREFEKVSGAGHRHTIVAMTANALSKDRDLCINAGMDEYISKPFKFSNLQPILDTYIGTDAPISQSEVRLISENISDGLADDVDFSAKHLVDDAYFTYKEAYEMIVGFIQGLHSELNSVKKHLNDEDIDAAQFAVHSVKGTAANLRLKILSAIAFDIEKAIKDKNFTKALSNLSNARAYADQMQKKLT